MATDHTDHWGGAEEYRPEKKEGKPAAPAAARVAADIMRAHRFVQGPSGEVYEYIVAEGWWRDRSDDYLRALAKQFDAASVSRRRSEIVDTIKASVHDADLRWGRLGDGEIACLSGIVDVRTGAERPHAADHWLESIIPHKYCPDAVCERWMQALDEWFEDDCGRLKALQELFGYIVLEHARYKKAGMLYGPSHAGKSKVLDVLRMLAGERWVQAVAIRDFDDPMRRWALVGKRLNIVSEVGGDEILNSAGFNAIVSTEEPIAVDPKYKRPYMYIPKVKVVIACNEFPDILERSGATLNRLLLIPFDRVIPEKDRDPLLAAKLGGEMEGIFAWSVVGAKRLVERGGVFTEVGAAAAMLEDLRAEINPIEAFVAREMIKDDGDSTPLLDIVQRFNREGYGRTSARKVGRMLRAAYGADAVRQARHGEGTARSLMGWRLAAVKM